MSDDDGVCGCIVVLAALFAVYKGIEWAIPKYGMEYVNIVIGVIVIIIATLIFLESESKTDSRTEKGSLTITFGIVWFILVLVISLIIDVLSKKGGEDLFIFTLILNLPGTFVILHIGAGKFKSKSDITDINDQISEGRKIKYFAVFWLFFWPMLYIILSYLGISKKPDNVLLSFIVISIPGMFGGMMTSRWLSKINKQLIIKELEELRNKERRMEIKSEEIERKNEEIKTQRKTLVDKEKQNAKRAKELDERLKNLEVAYAELESLEKEIKNNPFQYMFREKEEAFLDAFVLEIKELSKMNTGDIPDNITSADRLYLEFVNKLKDKIVELESICYSEAFAKYFESNGGITKTKYSAISAKYNPNIYSQNSENGTRRNKKWAEKRRIELSRIYNRMKDEL